jgi:hypothetical protein
MTDSTFDPETESMNTYISIAVVALSLSACVNSPRYGQTFDDTTSSIAFTGYTEMPNDPLAIQASLRGWQTIATTNTSSNPGTVDDGEVVHTIYDYGTFVVVPSQYWSPIDGGGYGAVVRVVHLDAGGGIDYPLRSFMQSSDEGSPENQYNRGVKPADIWRDHSIVDGVTFIRANAMSD